MLEMISAVKQLTIIVILVISIVGFVNSENSNEICSQYTGRRIYLDENGSGTIQAVNVTASTLKNVRKLFFFGDLIFHEQKNSRVFKGQLFSKFIWI